MLSDVFFVYRCFEAATCEVPIQLFGCVLQCVIIAIVDVKNVVVPLHLMPLRQDDRQVA